MTLCGLESLRGFSAAGREAWRRAAPVLALLGVDRWADDERRALVALIRAKGARSERGYVDRFLAHPRLEAALRAWIRAHREGSRARR